jgi:DNA-directed RNA polymerase subunit RPC12/RpoP
MLIGEAKTIGKRKYLVMGSGNTPFEALMDYQRVSFYDVYECGVCKSKNLILRSRLAGEDDFEYSEIKCLDCKAQLVIGQTKKTNEFFLRKKKDGSYDWQVYNAEK